MSETSGKTVLLVDDDRDILSAMQTALQDLDVTIRTASDGNKALTQAQQHDPDVVVLDMMMPKRSGFLVLEKLKQGRSEADRPRVIMVTANEGVRHQVYAESLGVSRYLHKPFRMDKLTEAVRELLD